MFRLDGLWFRGFGFNVLKLWGSASGFTLKFYSTGLKGLRLLHHELRSHVN